jgi:phosphatidate cytidylyltransferase
MDNLKRICTAVVLFPLVIAILIVKNQYVIDAFLTIIAIMAIYEYLGAVSKVCKPIKWISYLSALSIMGLHIVPSEYLIKIAIIAIPTLFVIMFLQLILTDMKTNFKDIAFTFFGICYVVIFLACISLLRGMANGIILVWYAIIAAWGTDTMAYFTGKLIGKHKFSKVSPKKSIEGCIGGIVGAVLIACIFTFFVNKYANVNYSYIYISCITIILSIIGQIGDFSASSIKRFVEIKDFSNLMPGHGGMLDRIDSLLFIAPFAYVLLSLIIF